MKKGKKGKGKGQGLYRRQGRGGVLTLFTTSSFMLSSNFQRRMPTNLDRMPTNLERAPPSWWRA